VKVLLFSLLFFHLLEARENPFTPLFDNHSQTENDIPILNITTNPTFATPKIKIIKKTTLPTIKIVENVPRPQVPTIKSLPVVVKPVVVEPVAPQVIMIEEPKVVPPRKKKHSKKIKNKTVHYRTLYQNYFLKITTNNKHIKIFTKDSLIEKRTYKNPTRISLDFDKLQYFHTKSIPLHNKYARSLKVGSHHDFYRITLSLKQKKSFHTRHKSYGYLLTFD